jgi:uncharacterized protein YjbI with pentapeptide repeats
MNSHSRHIYGTKFSQDSLNRNLQEVVGGQLATFKYLLAIFAIALTIISGSFAGMLGGYISFGIFFDPKKQAPLVYGCLTLIVIVWVIQSVYKGLSKGLITALLVATASSIFLVLVYRDALFLRLTLFFTLVAIGAAFLSLLAGGLSSAMIFALCGKQRSLKVVYALLTITTSIGMSYLIVSTSEKTLLFPIIFASVKLIAGLLSGIIAISASLSITRFETKHPKHFLFFRHWAIAFCSWRGTSFYNLDLSGVNFRDAKLANTDLRARKLYRTCFQGVTGLDRARVDNQYLDLENPKVQKLLTRKPGAGEYSEDKNFSKINLQGAYLQGLDMQKFEFIESNLTGADLKGAILTGAILTGAILTGAKLTGADLRGAILTGAILTGADLIGADLEHAILTGANLNNANLNNANLNNANLVKTQALGATFSEAVLTGACIQDWSINENTYFNDVRGKYIYLKFGQHQLGEKQPCDREFRAGELQKWIIKTYQAFNLIYRQKLELIAFVIALAQTAKEHEGVDVSHFSIEKNGNSILAKLGVFQGADTSAIPQSFINYYKDAVVIQGEEHNIVMNPNAEVKIVEKKKETHVGGDIIGGDKGNKTTVGNITAGDVTGSALVGDLSGQVSVTIQQLKDVKAADSDELASILTALQEAIPGDSALSETQQRSALKAVETIAKEGKKPPKERDSDREHPAF